VLSPNSDGNAPTPNLADGETLSASFSKLEEMGVDEPVSDTVSNEGWSVLCFEGFTGSCCGE
jgi:hypothetical protein